MFSLKLYAIILAIFPIYGTQSQIVTSPNNVTYYLNKAPSFKWFDAYLECSYRGMQLVTVDSKKQYDDILAMLAKNQSPLLLWVNGIGDGNKYAWLSTGNSIKPDLWSSKFIPPSAAKCVILWDGYGVNPKDCETLTGYLCEKRVQPGDCCADESNITLNVAQTNTCTK